MTKDRNLQTKGHNSVRQTELEGGRTVDGYVVTEYGIVIVESYWYWNETGSSLGTTFRFVWNGRLHVRKEPCFRWKTSISRAATRFAEHIVWLYKDWKNE